MVSNCPRCQIVLGVKLSSLPSWCQIVLLAIMVSNCPKCQMVLGVKLSVVSNGPRINLHASDEEIQQLGQVEVEDGREIPGSQENDLELPDPERDQAPSVDRPGVVQVLVGGRKRIRDLTTSHLEPSPKVKRSRKRPAKLLLFFFFLSF